MLNIISWNTFLAPLMYKRESRIKKILDKIKIISENTDILLFQELNSFKSGFFTYYLYKLLLLLKIDIICPKFITIFELLMIIEGYIIPYKNIDYNQKIIEYCKNLNYRYYHKSNYSKKFINSGLLICSKYKIYSKYDYELSGDFLHTPGIIGIKIKVRNKFINIFNLHLCPTLDNISFSYKLVNFINYINNNLTRDNRNKSILKIKKILDEQEIPYIIGGDFNINLPCKEIKKYLKLLNTNLIKLKSDINYTHIESNNKLKKLIDFFIIDNNIKNKIFIKDILCNLLLNTNADDYNKMININGSDHYPIKLNIT